MAVYRQIQITFWQDNFILSLTPEEKFFYLYLLSNSKTKQCGIYELPFQIAQFETGYNKETIEKLIKKFEITGRICYDYETDEIAMLNWRKYNDSTSHKTQVCVMGELANVKSEKLLKLMQYENHQIVSANKNYRISDKLRAKILDRDNNKCKKCGTINDLTIDHVYPRSLGGKSDEFNLRTLCRSCNSKRVLIGDELIKEIKESGYDYEMLKNAYQSPIRGETQKEKEEEKEKEEPIGVEIKSVKKEYFLDMLPITLTQPQIEAWTEWVDYRGEIKKKLTKRSAKMQIEFLLNQPDLIKCIGQSIQNQWTGLFPIKTDKPKSTIDIDMVRARQEKEKEKQELLKIIRKSESNLADFSLVKDAFKFPEPTKEKKPDTYEKSKQEFEQAIKGE